MKRCHVLAAEFALAVALSGGCAPYARVAKIEPIFRPTDSVSVELGSWGHGIETARRSQKREPIRAIGGYLAVARDARQVLARDPADIAARDTYNFAVARVIGAIQETRLDPWKQPLRVHSDAGDFDLTHEPAPDSLHDPARYDLTPADEIKITGSLVRERQRKDGIGAPVVAIERGTDKHARKDLLMPKIHCGVTALIRFDGRRAVISFEDPLATERVGFAGHSHPLAADFTAPIAVLLARQDPRKLEIQGLLHPDNDAEAARLTLTRPYDPDKKVVLIIHGLKDTPATWAPMVNHLQADEKLRRNYQIWFYGYPSGYPYPHSAAILRRELDAIQGRYPLRNKMVVIGHSMGGCISRLLITDTGDELWKKIFGTPPSQTPLPADSKDTLREELVFRYRPEVGRVIFIAAPLRGSGLARTWVGRFGSALVKLPYSVLDTGNAAVRVIAFQDNERRLDRAPNSLDLLTPDNRFVLAIQSIPVTPGILHHVICGDRGKGGRKDKTSPVMSDGVVPYWSSHMETAESELIVPSGHSAHQHPHAIQEVARILKLHARR
jgi:pimeloyl-ACP methyl ester carboxylesterase